MHAAAAHPQNDVLGGHVDFEHIVERHAGRAQRVGLRQRPGKAIEQVTVRAVGLLQPVLDQADDDVVRYQRAAIHHFFRGEPQRRPGLDR